MQNDPQNNTGEGRFGASNFILKNSEGVFVEPAKLESASQFTHFVERVFSTGYYFAGLEYTTFLELLCAQKNPEDPNGRGRLRIASDILSFSPERRQLYRKPRIVAENAEYLFEPVVIEKRIEEPIYAESETGSMEIVGIEARNVSEKTTLSFDEFVAAMWGNGVRFGIDADAVRQMIGSGKAGRIVFATPLQPQAGQDSSLKEQTNKLYRDNSPRELPNGKIDLRQFSNRFPQIKKGERLLRKMPRIVGIPGRDINGTPIDPPMPQDFDIAPLVGPGTRLEHTSEGEFIVATIDGFLNIDIKTNRISVTEKIINYGGVNMRTTGDLSLEGEHFEEHGDIQEKRVVEGKNITVLADVFGSVVSTGGKIHLHQNLIGGSATNRDGDIVVDGLASNAQIQAKSGTVRLKRAENSLIVARHLSVESAINCTILGETVEIDASEGCAIAGKKIRLGTAGPRRENQTVVSVLIPDLAELNEKIAEAGKKAASAGIEIEEKRRKVGELTGQQEIKNYLVIAGKLQRKEISLSEDQKPNWQKLCIRVAPTLKTISAINAEIQALRSEQENFEKEVQRLELQKQHATNGISCSIDGMTDETIVRKKKNATPLTDLPLKELWLRLREPGLPEDFLPHDGGERFSWRYPSA